MRSIFLTSPGRCGSHWLGWMLRDALGLEKYPLKPWGDNLDERWQRLVEEAATANDRDSRFFIHHPPLKYLQDLDAWIVALVRDPRDTAISMAYYCLRPETDIYRAEISWQLEDIPRGATEKEMLSYFKKCGVNSAWWDSYLLDGWTAHLTIKYEDLQRDPASIVRKICRLVGSYVEEEALEGIIRARSFKFFSKGRERGEEDKGHHYRKGVVGDWKNYFTDEENEQFCQTFRKYMRACNYGNPIRNVQSR